MAFLTKIDGLSLEKSNLSQNPKIHHSYPIKSCFCLSKKVLSIQKATFVACKIPPQYKVKKICRIPYKSVMNEF
ncbi:MAG: hypothetical protein JNL70_05595 [Saprospiraceae bacterium]|nr:hypothetical protein [Saprospiraceae bacterium]